MSTHAMMLNTRKGYTLVELMVAVFLTAILGLVLATIISQTTRYFRVTSVRQQLQSDADRAMNMMIRTLQNAQVKSVAICSCGSDSCYANQHPTPPPDGCQLLSPYDSGNWPPNSRIEFSPVGSTAVNSIYWYNGTVFLQIAGQAPMPLTNNVTGLMFTGDGSDFSRIYITLHLNAPISGQQTATVILANQAVRLVQ